MAYTNVWNDASPTGSEAANTIDDIFRSVKVDIEQRFVDIFAMPNFTADPLRPYGLRFTDAQNSIIYLGDNAGTSRSLVIMDKTGATTYGSISQNGFSITPVVATASNNALYVSQTWNNAGVTYSGVVFDFTSVASNAASSIVNFKMAGVSLASIRKDGLIIGTAGISISAGTSAFQAVTATTIVASDVQFASVTTSSNIVLNTNDTYLYVKTTGGLSKKVVGMTSGNVLQFDGSGYGSTFAGTVAVSDTVTITKSGEAIIFGSASRKLYGRADGTGVSLFTGAVQTGSGLYANESAQTVSLYANSLEITRVTATGLTILSTYGLTVSGGTSAFQAITATTGGFTGDVTITSGNLYLATNGKALQGFTTGSARVNLLTLTGDTNNITRFVAGVDAGGFQWTNQAQSTAWMALTSGGLLTVNNGAAINGQTIITSTGGTPLKVQYDTSNRLDINVGSTGGVTFDAIGAGAGFTFSDTVTLSGGAVLPVNVPLYTNTGSANIRTALNTGTSIYYGDIDNTTNENLLLLAGGSGVINLYVNGTVKATINSAGLGVGTVPSSYPFHVATSNNNFLGFFNNTNANPFGVGITYGSAAPNNSTNEFLYCADNAGVRTRILSNGGLQNYQANNVNLSDERTKIMGDIIDANLWYDRFTRLNIRNFKYKDQAHDDWNIGLGAWEFEKVAPELVDINSWEVNGEKMKTIFTTDLYHAHIAVTQEIQRRLERLESKFIN